MRAQSMQNFLIADVLKFTALINVTFAIGDQRVPDA